MFEKDNRINKNLMRGGKNSSSSSSSSSSKLLLVLSLFSLLSLIRCSFSDEYDSFDDHKPSSKMKINDRQVKGETEVTIPIRGHSIYAPYVDSDLQNRWFDFGGSTIIETSKYIRLTQERSSQAGYLWSRYPISHPNFQVEVEFKIDGKSSNIYGDGMAVWFTRNAQQLGPVFGSSDMWDGMGLFIDTFANSRHSYAFPRIMGMMNNGYKTYDVGNDGEGQESGSCSLNVRGSEVATKLKINYVRGQFFEVLVQHENWEEWDHCFTIFNYTLPESPYLGFSAHTGEVSDNHDIIYVLSTGLVYHPPDPSKSDRKDKKKSESWFFGKKNKNDDEDESYDSLGGGIGSGIRLGFWSRMIAYLMWMIKFVFLLSLVGVGLFWANKFFVKYKKESMKRF